jgi:thymidylate synthase (FAD)
MVDMTIEIETSRGIAQQILRHRSFSFQEFSQRYAEVTDMEPIQLRKSGATNRQSSLEVFDPIIDANVEASRLIKNHLKECEDLDKSLLNAGVAKECARFVLPITTQTKIYMKGSVRSWIHYLQIRCDEHTQLEHREIALAIREIFAEQFPNIAKGLGL